MSCGAPAVTLFETAGHAAMGTAEHEHVLRRPRAHHHRCGEGGTSDRCDLCDRETHDAPLFEFFDDPGAARDSASARSPIRCGDAAGDRPSANVELFPPQSACGNPKRAEAFAERRHHRRRSAHVDPFLRAAEVSVCHLLGGQQTFSFRLDDRCAERGGFPADGIVEVDAPSKDPSRERIQLMNGVMPIPPAIQI
jgi:hypothetical protein